MAPKKAPSPVPSSPEPPAEEEAKEEEGVPEVVEGDFLFQDGSEYSGEYIAQKGRPPVLTGRGRLQMGPEVFEGTFENGSYKEGTYNVADGSVYCGGFRGRSFHGHGEYVWPDGRIYKGMWQDGVMHGRGVFHGFSLDAGKAFEGFCCRGNYQSSLEGQEDARRAFLAEYGTALAHGAVAALRDIVAKAQPAEPAGAKGKKPGGADEGHCMVPAEYLVPAGGEEGAAERALVEALVAGPFVETTAIRAAALNAFAGLFAEGGEQLGQAVVFEDRSLQSGAFDCSRLRRDQLAYVGQAVALRAPPTTPPGSMGQLVLVNVSDQFDASKARWKLIHCEDVPHPPGSEETAHEVKKK